MKNNHNKLRRKMAITCLTVFTAVNTCSTVMAMTSIDNMDGSSVTLDMHKDTTNKQDKKRKIKVEQNQEEILGTKYIQNQENCDKFLVAKNMEQAKKNVHIPKKPDKEKLQDRSKTSKSFSKVQRAIKGQKAEPSQTYSLSALSAMKYEDMMDAISSTSWDKIPGLFENTADSRAFFNDTQRFKYIMSDLAKRGAEFTATDDKGIPTIVEVIRGGFYLGYYNVSQFPGIWSDSMTKLCLPAMNAILNNKNLSVDSTPGVIEAFGSLIGNTTVTPEIMNDCVDKILVPFRLKSVDYLGEYAKANAVYKVISGIGFVMNTELDKYDKQPASNHPCYGKINKYIDEMCAIAGTTVAYSDDQWYIDNGISYGAGYASLHTDPNKILKIFTDIMDSAMKYSATYFNVAWELSGTLGGSNSRGEFIDFDKLAAEGNEFWMPNEYVFDDGAIVIHAGEDVSPEKIERMYWATKEVESQFFRVNGIDKAIEPNNADKVLTIRLYNSPNEYKMNEYINGIDTNNGGMYVEPSGTFYTYERTEAESVYSLEELFRHEFTHYLQGKYQVPGMWGEGDFYKNSDIEWFDEGTAEFFAGSTRTEGVQPRKAIIGYLDKNQSNRYTISKLIQSGYKSGWDFYNYGWAYVSYMYNNNIGNMMQLNDAIMNYKISDFRSILRNDANNNSTEASYQQYMDTVMNDSRIGTPLVSDAYVKTHDKRSLAEIKQDIISVSGVQNFTESKTGSGKFGTFKLEGKYSGGMSRGKVEDWKEMNQIANQMLNSLSAKGWSGYETVTCYFTDYKVVNGVYQYNLVFRGLLNDGSTGGGSIMKPKVLTIEKESNDSMEEAAKHGAISNNLEMKAVSSDGSDADYFAFDVEKEGAVNIKLTGGNGKLTWVVFREDNVGEYSCWSQYTSGDSTTGTFTGKPGRYFIKVYPVATTVSNLEYKILIDGIKDYVGTETKPDTKPDEKPDTKPDTKPDEKPDEKPDTKPDTKPEMVKILKEEVESNNSPEEADAHGFISNNTEVKCVSSNQTDEDYYAFEVDKAGKVNITVTGGSSELTWVVMKADDFSKYPCWSQFKTNNATIGNFEASPGKYYLRIYPIDKKAVTNLSYSIRIEGIKSYTEEGTNKPGDTTGDVELESNNVETTANLISNSKNMNGSLLNGGEIDMFCFNVDKAGKVDIRVNSKSAQYTWVVYKETERGSFICWSQNSDENGSNGSFNATEGKYYMMVYSMNPNKIDYTIKINGIK